MEIKFKKIIDNKKELRAKIQQTFTIIRNKLKEREEELLFEVDKQIDNLIIKNDIIKESQELPNKIKIILEKGKNTLNEWKEISKLNVLINDCINIEKIIKEINGIKENMKSVISNNVIVKFYPEKKDEDFIKYLDIIKTFGKISSDNLNFKQNIIKEENQIFEEQEGDSKTIFVNYKKNNIKDYKDDEILIEKGIDLKSLNNQPLIKLILPKNANPLINIILHCLSNIKYLINYYLNPTKGNKILQKSKENPNNNYLAPSFLKLLYHLWKSNKKEYSPNEIHNDLKKLMVNNYDSDDAGKIFYYILTKLNEEMNFNRVNNNKEDDPFIHFDKKKTFEEYQKNFKLNITFISNSFYSTIEIKKRCLNCNDAPSYFFEASPIITIFLKANNDEILNKLTLEDHLKTLLIEEEKRIIIENCLICCSEQKKIVNKDIFTSTEILIMNINRDKDPNNNISFIFPEIFEGRKIINNELNLPNYELTTVIKKVKNNLNNFEYIYFFKSFIDKKWYSFNNQRIELIGNNYKNDIFDFKNTCILIYNKK